MDLDVGWTPVADLLSAIGKAGSVAAVLASVHETASRSLSCARTAAILCGTPPGPGMALLLDGDRGEGISFGLAGYPELARALDRSVPAVLGSLSPLLPVPAPGHHLRLEPVTSGDAAIGALLLELPAAACPEAALSGLLAFLAVHALRGHLLSNPSGAREETGRRVGEARQRLLDLQRFEEVFEHASDGMAILDATGWILSLNRAGEAILSLSRTEARRVRLTDLLAAGDRTVLSGLDPSGPSGPHDLHLMPVPGGREVVVSAAFSRPLAGHGARLVSFRDVTGERKAQADLRRTKEFLERLLDTSIEGVVVADPSGHVQMVNRRAAAILGPWTEGAPPRRLGDLFPSGGTEDLLRDLGSLGKGGRGHVGPVRADLLSATGETVPVVLSASSIPDGAREHVIVVSFTDLRERLRIEAELHRTAVEAARLAALAELSGAAAHELNQPLTVVSAHAEALQATVPEDDPARPAVEGIAREVDRMAGIVRRIGRITHYETQGYVGSARIVDLERSSEDDADPIVG